MSISSKYEKIKLVVVYATCVVCMLLMPNVLYAQVKWNSAYQAYIDEYKDLAIEQMLVHGIPASITMAQGLLESGAGRSTLALKGNNHFGIKCHDWTGPSMRKNDDELNECFRVYNSPKESYEDHSVFLKRPRYKSLFTLSRTDYKGWARGLKSCGYATNPVYAQSLINIIETYKLYELDKAKTYDHFKFNHSAITADIGVDQPHIIKLYNKNYYVVARQGDTFKSLSKEVGISYRKLAKYNERDKHDVLSEGDVVYLKKKQKHALKDFKKRMHIVKDGESMYTISQMYGMQMKYLYKKNKLTPDYVPKVGDQLKVY